MEQRLLLFFVYLALSLGGSHGQQCTMENVTQWLAPQHIYMKDTDKGIIISRGTANTEEIESTDFGDGLIRGPYLEIALTDSVFTVSTTAAFTEYEEHETLLSIRFTTIFRCTGGSTRPLAFVFNIIDTNNHIPVFKPLDSYDFPLALPVPPGFKVSGCEYMIVRDVDLTTTGIEFNIEDNPYFEIVYHGPTQPKEFGAFIRTKTLITSLPESLSLQINATDIDLTDDEPHTSIATVNILADNAFRLPEQPIFSKAFYKATYTEEHDLVLWEYISLRQGYDEEVKFNITGEYKDYFDLVDNNNQLSFRVKSPLPEDVSTAQIYLVITAQREFTSETFATVVIFLPEGTILKFESSLYEGQIEGNVLRVPNITLKQGYEDIVNIDIINEYASYFSTSRLGNMIVLAMDPLPIAVIRENNVINLEVVAFTRRNTTASTITVLEIIKDDYITPIFEKTVYNGYYDSYEGLVIEPIVLSQGYDNTVTFNLKGEHSSYFQKVSNDAIINLSATIPTQIWSEGTLLIVVEATKPRTVGANAAVYISLPAPRVLSFEAPYYTGSLENNELILETIVLSLGYAADVRFNLSGEFASFFTASHEQNRVTISLQSDIPEAVMLDNSALLLTLTATGLNALTANTNVLLNVIKEDHITPVFQKARYDGMYSVTGLIIEPIEIIQGHDDTVKYSLYGEYSELFALNVEGRTIILSGTVPAQIWREQKLVLTLQATKPGTVGSHTTILITLPEARELRFQESSYIGNIRNNVLIIEDIVFSIESTSDLKFMITGEHAHFFNLTISGYKLSLNLSAPLPDNIILDNDFVTLTISATGLNIITTFTTIILEIKKDDTTTPVFSHTIYEGIYKDSSNIDIENISLIQGYDSTVSFRLYGDHAQYFEINNTKNNISISLKSIIPMELIFNEKRLLFKVLAEKDLTVGATAVVSIQFPAELTEPTPMQFSKTAYMSTLQNKTFIVTEKIVLESGFTTETKFILSGDYSQYFTLTNSHNVITISILNTPPQEELKNNKFIILELEARQERAVSAFASVVIDVVNENVVILPVFEKAFYSGTFTKDNGLIFDQNIRLVSGFDDTVSFGLEGDFAKWFTLQQNGNLVSVIQKSDTDIPDDIIELNNHLLFTIVASKPGSDGGKSAISISLPKDQRNQVILRFEENNYVGHIKNGTLHLPSLSLNKDVEKIEFKITGEYSDYFNFTKYDDYITIELTSELHVNGIETSFFVLTIEASQIEAISGYTTVILSIPKEDISHVVVPVFEKPYYIGEYSEEEALKFNHSIRLIQGYHESVSFAFEGDDSRGFILKHETPNNIMLSIADEGLPEISGRNQLTFSIVANKPNSVPGHTAIIIYLTEFLVRKSLRFTDDYYKGSIKEGKLNLDVITLKDGYSEDVKFYLTGDYSYYFQFTNEDGNINIQLALGLPSEVCERYNVLILTLEALKDDFRAHTTIILEIKPKTDLDRPAMIFENTYYTGSYSETNGLFFDSHIRLYGAIQDKVLFSLEGDDSVWFGLDQKSENAVALIMTHPIPPAVLATNEKLIFVITATRLGSVQARATIIISLAEASPTDPVPTFDKILYNGLIRINIVTHESITISGYHGSTIEIVGQYADLFEQNLLDEEVKINLKLSAVLPNITHIALELRADVAKAVLLLNIQESETPVLPTVTFGSPSYVMRVDVSHVGFIGQVHATSDNGEPLTYSIIIDNGHLRERLTIDSDGRLQLSAPASSGVHAFQVVATTIVTGAFATVSVHLTVDALTICGDNIVVSPLIILERDEEEPHRNLVVLNETIFPGCRFTLSNSWPQNQSWLYVDDKGLHTIAIDREDQSIAFMALSQIQVELILACEDDVTSRTKRSLDRTDWLGPYDYGSNKWILTDTISYNARRSVVNLIVNDINDNTPKFIDKDQEPIAVGYPVAEVEEIILPRALAEVKATDADVGENAALIYWSSEESLAVSPTTGFVHVRNNYNLQNDARLIIHATDRNGAGLTGTLELLVRILEKNNIAVVTIRNAFLDDEKQILSNLTNAVGYEVKSLKSVVVTESKLSREKQYTVASSGVSLQLFIYGLIEREPVQADQLTTDINSSNIVAVASSVSLEDHLEGNEICVLPRRDTELLVATIVLSVLLFILIAAIAVWFFLKWRKINNYEQFSGRNSLPSRNDSLEQPKLESIAEPRLNIEELKRSERRLQERLDVPVSEVSVQPSISNQNPFEGFISISTPESQLPIVIQTIDKLKDNTEESEDDDEFGEKIKSRRKSVVTFNENVEKIIHVEDNPESSDYEVFSF